MPKISKYALKEERLASFGLVTPAPKDYKPEPELLSKTVAAPRMRGKTHAGQTPFATFFGMTRLLKKSK